MFFLCKIHLEESSNILKLLVWKSLFGYATTLQQLCEKGRLGKPAEIIISCQLQGRVQRWWWHDNDSHSATHKHWELPGFSFSTDFNTPQPHLVTLCCQIAVVTHLLTHRSPLHIIWFLALEVTADTGKVCLVGPAESSEKKLCSQKHCSYPTHGGFKKKKLLLSISTCSKIPGHLLQSLSCQSMNYMQPQSHWHCGWPIPHPTLRTQPRNRFPPADVFSACKAKPLVGEARLFLRLNLSPPPIRPHSSAVSANSTTLIDRCFFFTLSSLNLHLT